MRRLRKFLLDNKLLSLVLILWFISLIVVTFTYPIDGDTLKVISWDTFGYYLYLPATFIYHDLYQLKFAEPIMFKYDLSQYFYAARIGPTGDYVMNYSMGTAILYFPFFCIGHLMAAVLRYPTDGFSAPYQYSIFIGGMVYSLIGIVVTMRTLRYFFSEKITCLLIIILLAGTNYYYYATTENAMTHNYLFTVAACIIYLSIKWHQNQRMRYAVLLGLLIGLAIIIRPTEILWCLIPLLWAVSDLVSVKQKFLTVKRNLWQLFCLVFCVFAMGLLQMIYWKMASGKFIYYSYDGYFDFLDPHIMDGLLSYRKGWLMYTPVMTLALLGLPFLWTRKRELFLPCLVFTVLVIYITFSWSAWSYGGSFGARPMVETYALMLFPMGAFISTMFRFATVKYVLLLFIAFCIFLNCFQTWQFLHSFYTHDGPDEYRYKVVFLRTHKNRPIIRSFFNLEKPSSPIADSLGIYPRAGNGNPADSIPTPPVERIINDSIGQFVYDTMVNTAGYNYLRIDGRAMFEPFQENSKKFSYMLVTLQSQTKGEPIESKMPLQPLIGNGGPYIGWERDLQGVPYKWDDVWMYVRLPADDSFRIRVAIKNPGGNNLHFNDLRVSLLKEGD